MCSMLAPGIRIHNFASPCSFNELCLPDHATYEAFEAALKMAITEGSEGFGVV